MKKVYVIVSICCLFFLYACQRSDKDTRTAIEFLQQSEVAKENKLSITPNDENSTDTLHVYCIKTKNGQAFTIYITNFDDTFLKSVNGICVNNDKELQDIFQKVAISFLTFHEFELTTQQQKQMETNIRNVKLRDFTSEEFTHSSLDYTYGMQEDMKLRCFSYYTKE